MTDDEMWGNAVAAVAREYAALPLPLSTLVGERASTIRECKRALNAISQEVSGGDICAACRGECCTRGRHHFTVIDLLIHLAAGRPLPTPDFAGDRCPWLGSSGCCMEAAYRPFNCVIFNCERVEELMEPSAWTEFYRVEQELRGAYRELEDLFGNRFMQGLLLNYERAVADGGAVLSRVGKA